MLTIEVIPFLVLAVGVDNIFMLVHAYQRLTDADKADGNVDDAETVVRQADRIGAALGQVGPSILLTSVTEAGCFAIGSLSGMPAVRTFALYACVAILLDFLLQITVFVALLALDQRRYADRRWDMLCCVRSTPGGCHDDGDYDDGDDDDDEASTDRRRRHRSVGLVQAAVERFYAPVLLARWSRPLVLCAFIVVTCLSVMVIPSIEPGLDQKLAMASDSHVVKYFAFMQELLSMGAPVYWVIGPGLAMNRTKEQDLMCGGTKCRDDSVPTQLYLAANYPEM